MARRATTNLDGDPDGRDVGYVLDRYRRLLNSWYMFGIEAQEIADFVIPRKNSIVFQRIPGAKRTQKQYDSTAPDAAEKLASSLHGTLTSPYIEWFQLTFDDPELMAIPAVQDWAQKCSARMLAEFNKSNLSQESHEMYLDLVCFGTGCLFEEEAERQDNGDWGGLLFRVVACGRYVCAEAPDGKVNAVFRTCPMSTEAIRMHPGWTVPPELKDMKPDLMHEVIHGVFPEKDIKGKPTWKSIYLLYKGKHLLGEDEFFEFPYMVPRWSKVPDETYGRGPCHSALPDIRSLNKIVELELRRIALDVHPPMKELNGDVIGPIRMVPGGKTSVRGNIDSVQPLFTGSERTFQVVNLKKEELVNSIHRLLFYDQLQLPQGPQMTAEEVVTRMELMERLLGPTSGRLESEYLRPMIDRSWAIMLRRSPGCLQGLDNPRAVLPPAPPELTQYLMTRKVSLHIRFEGPLARAQKSADVTAIQKTQSFVLPMAQVDPQVIQVIDWDEAVRHTASILGVPAKLIRDKDQMDQIRQAQQQKQQQAEQMQAQNTAADTAGKVAPLMKAGQKAPEEGSPMQALTGTMQQQGMTNGTAGTGVPPTQ